MSKRTPFIDRALQGRVLHLESIDDEVAAWHKTEEDVGTLAEWLGMTDAEYGVWMREPDALPWILHARKRGIDLDEILAARGPVAVAARGSDGETDRLIEWLRDNGFIQA